MPLTLVIWSAVMAYGLPAGEIDFTFAASALTPIAEPPRGKGLLINNRIGGGW